MYLICYEREELIKLIPIIQNLKKKYNIKTYLDNTKV